MGPQRDRLSGVVPALHCIDWRSYQSGFTATGSDGTDGACVIEWSPGTDNPLNIAFAGVGTLTVNADRQRLAQQLIIAAPFIGSGNLAVAAIRAIGPGLTLLGSGSVVADAIRRIRPGTTILGSGGVACDAAYRWTPAGGLTPF
jgi:hypothetical protein